MLCKAPGFFNGLVHECYYQERIRIADVIAQTPEIQSASYHGFDDFPIENIVVTEIELRERPDANLRLCRLEDHENGSFRHLHVQQIGKLNFCVGGFRDSDAPDKKTGKPVKRAFWWSDVDIGPDSKLKDILPFTVSTLDELIERYDEIIAYFETWPSPENRGTIRLSDGSELYYYIQSK